MMEEKALAAKAVLSFEKIVLSIDIQSENTHPKNIKRTINLSKKTFCPVRAIIKNNVDVITEYVIHR